MANLENDYRKLSQSIQMNDALKSRIAQAARTQTESDAIEQTSQVDAHSQSDASQHATSPSSARPALITRRRFAKIGAAAAVAAAAALGVGFSPRIFQAINGSDDSQEGGGVAHAFGLLAYADEPDAAPNQVKDLVMDCFTTAHDQRGGWMADESEDQTAARGWTFDLTCIGDNIQSVTYALGEGTYSQADLDAGEFACFYEEEQIIENGERLGATDVRKGAIEIAYSEDASLGSHEESDPSFHRAINVGTHISDETLHYGKEYSRLFNELYYSDHDKLDRLLTEYTVRETYEVALKLSETPLVITARFTDGTTQTKRYRIAPKDDYIEKMVAQGVHFDDTGMYTISEIA